MFRCAELIGRPYRLGANGTDKDGAIDCIHLVYAVLTDLDIPTPAFNPAWYTASHRSVARDLLSWGRRISEPSYDGDVLLLRQDQMAFAVAWSQGILYINNRLQRVAWSLPEIVGNCYAFRCSRLNAN
jgi:cell wall-associated NlpC family hydrolase